MSVPLAKILDTLCTDCSGSRTYLPLVRWDFIAGLGPRSFNLKPNSSRGWNAGSHRSGRIARRVARLVVCYPPTPASLVPPSTFLSSYPSFRRRILKHPCFTGVPSAHAAAFDLVHFECDLGMKLNYARFNSGQLIRIILVTTNRLDPGFCVRYHLAANFTRWYRQPAAATCFFTKSHATSLKRYKMFVWKFRGLLIKPPC